LWAIWICPKRDARLANRNLWPSCGQSTLETLFAGATPGVLELARTYVAMLHSFSDIQVIPQKTRLVCVARGGSRACPRQAWLSSRATTSKHGTDVTVFSPLGSLLADKGGWLRHSA
jgi:hypothetical protein